MKTIKAGKHEIVDILGQTDLFGGIGKVEREFLAESCLLRSYDAGELLFLEETQASGFFVLAKGSIMVYRSSADGRRQILHIFEIAGDICGEVPVFEGGSYPASAEMSQPGRVLYVSRSDFLALTRRYPDVLLQMLALLSKRLRRFVELIDDLSLKSVVSRMARYFQEQSGEGGQGMIRLDISKGMLASRLGTIPETVSRTLQKLQRSGVISVSGRSIRVLDNERLARLADGEVA